MSKSIGLIVRVVVTLVVAVAVLVPSITLAAAPDIGTDERPLLTVKSDTTTTSADFKVMIVKIVNIFIWIIGIVAVFYLLLSGFNYITAGGDDEKATAARKGIINAIIGIIIVVAAFYILNAARKAAEGEIGTTNSANGATSISGG